METVNYGSRLVLLCRAHAGIAKNSGVSSFEELRELYTEPHGLRSYVPRRARIAKAPTQGKGKGKSESKSRPRSSGRRATDAV